MTLASSAIIQDIDAMRKSGLASLAFYYCDFRGDQKKDRRGLLASMLVQLSHQSDSYCDMLFLISTWNMPGVYNSPAMMRFPDV